MKKLFYIAVLFAAVSTTFIACSKDEINENQKDTMVRDRVQMSQGDAMIIADETQIDFKDYGFYHNEGLKLYSQSQNGEVQTDSKYIIEEIAMQLQNQYPKEFEGVDLAKIQETFAETDPQNFDMVTFWNSNKENFYNNKYLSPTIGKLVDKIILEDLTYEQIMVEIQNFKKNNQLDSNELNGLTVFESVLTSSNDYWTANSIAAKKPKPGTKAIFADGLGALMFCYSGPGAIIAGCACSMFVNETQEP